MARGLQRRDRDVSIVTFSRQYPAFLFPGKSQFEREEGRDEEAARLIDSVNPRTWIAAARRIAAAAPDAVLMQYWLPFFAPAYATLAGRVKKQSGETRILAIAHNVLPHERRPGDAALGRYFLRRCDGVAALSAAVAEDARAIYPKGDVRTLVHPIYDHFGQAVSQDEARERLGISMDAEVMLFFGFVREYKGLHVLLDALPEIVEARPRAVLVVAGEFYEDERRYQRIIRSRGLEDRVHLINDYVPESDVPVYFSAADVAVQPYLSATQSGVVQTAFHFDRPAIVTDVGGLAEVVPHGEAGLIVEPNDPTALAEACIRFFSEDLAGRLTAGVRREKERHGWDPFLAAIEEMALGRRDDDCE